ncbi:MAG: SDR family NAD(P)-dependent oxidoreductase [Desulfobacteraceae bacterium]|nr:MAG: SDR family NAD(P)-dependent oxidoreductase [Desulfobacteraceae bacterium]
MEKIILVTGSTDGVGKLTAAKLAGNGHAVYLHGRSPEKLDATISEIRTMTKNEKVDGFVADFSDPDGVRQMVDQVNRDLSKMDILINNAGVFKSPEEYNKNGLDMRFAVNYFAPYLLTQGLISLLNKGSDPRVINLSSAAQSPVSLNALSGQESVSDWESYAQSKLALTMWSFHLAQACPEIAVIAVNPGSLLNTRMVAEAFGHHRSSADKGADILYDLAVSDKYKGITGKYFDNDQGCFAQAHPEAYRKTEVDRLIHATGNLI